MPTNLEDLKSPTRRKKHSLADLERCFTDSETIDKELFAEMRSNLLLIAGEHYNRNLSKFFRRVRDHKGLQETQKLRLTKNHIQRITKAYSNTITASNPGVGFRPKSESELADTKSAELHKAVWQDAWERYNLEDKVDRWVDDYVGVGEVATKLFFDPTAGPLRGYGPVLDEKGEPKREEPTDIDPNTGELIPGEMIPDLDDPIFEGEIVMEKVFGFNLLRPPEAKDMSDAPWLIIRKMVEKNKLMLQFPDKSDKIQVSEDETFKVFDTNSKMGFRDTRKNEVLVKEIYFKPGPDYPEGYFYIWTKEAILAEGELPGNVYPIKWAGFDNIQTSPRGISPVKHLRPYQAEINRAASKMAEHQVSLADDKILIQNGSKISAGVSLPGIRTVNVTGAPPTIMPGRDGSQYLGTLESNIREMYEVADLAETFAEDKGQQDPLVTLFKSAKSKRKFQRNIGRFERFLLSIAKGYLQLAKTHFEDDRIIVATGKAERVNISEFKNSEDMNFQIIIEPQTEDAEEKFGKQIMLGNALQFVGSSLDQEAIGKLLQEMPFASAKQTFSDLTIDRDAANNMILALDRGDNPLVSQFDDPVKMTKRLVARMRQADFNLLNPQIQQAYQTLVVQYQTLKVEQDKALLAAQAGFIPVDGPLVTIQGFFVRKPDNPTGTQLVRLPHSAIKWLIDTLEKQGQSLDELEDMNRGAQAQQAQLFLADSGQQNTGGNDVGTGVAGGAEGF